MGLSRSALPPITIPNSSSTAEVVQVDYANSTQLQTVLRDHQIDTIISTLANQDLTQFSAVQEVLLRAALNVPTFRRFAPSEFSVDSETLGTYNYYACKLPLLQTLRALKARHPHLEWTKFVPGVFTNYFAFGSPGMDEAMKYLSRRAVRVDISNGTANIPGDGETKLYFTTAEDTARFVAEATQLESWPEKLDMAGDVLGLNEVVKIAEDVTGKKIEVKYTTKDDILAVMNSPPKGWTDYFYLADLSIIDRDAEQGTILNEMLPSVKPMNVKQFIEKWWGGKQ
ncbi:hypothetical protein MPER_13075 [Moniliophthora perniciosa FA553]|nr:hypothetical protein MPER_13075 [Moniliophthora perniciosa FA553]